MVAPDAVVNAVHRLLLERPEEWDFDGYRVFHRKAGAAVWVANGRWGMHIEISGIRYGGVSAMIGPFVPWRRRIMKAARSVAEVRLLATLERVDG